MLASVLLGFLGRRLGGRISSAVRPRVLFMTTLLTWFVLILVSVPIFFFGIPGHSVSDAILESTASWTATGIGAYDADIMPLGLQLWRSTCNWLGGIGIIMVVITLLPSRQFMGWTLAATEFSGPDFLKERNEFRQNYRRIVAMYAGLSLVQFILLMIAGMNPIHAVMTALSNTATGGLHHINNGVITSLSVPLKAIITLFAFISSLNATAFINLIHRKWKNLKNSSEAKVYVPYVLGLTLLISFFVIKDGRSTGSAAAVFGSSLMQVISSVSTAGYIVSDVHSWPDASVIILLLMMFIGSCALSTGGGIKLARIIIAVKTASYSIYKCVHPSSVRSLTFDKKPLKSDQVIPANLLIALFMITYLLGALLLSLDNITLYQALNYSQAMLINTGISPGSLETPGLAVAFSSYGKLVLSVLMIAGRLEVYPILMLFFRGFWRSDSSI